MSQEQPDDMQPVASPQPGPVADLDDTQSVAPATPLPHTPQPITLPSQQPVALTNRLDMRKISTGISAVISQEWMQKTQEITAQWLYDLGGWIFGGLIIAALMLLQDLITLGFADRATLIAGLANAIALPFNLAGLGIVRYFNDLNQTSEKARQALAQSPNLDAEALIKLTRESDAFPPEKHKVMDSSISLALYLSVLFTLIGLSSALWRISWVATLLFLIACVIGVLLVWRVIRSS
jgi:hypothetical protein